MIYLLLNRCVCEERVCEHVWAFKNQFWKKEEDETIHPGILPLIWGDVYSSFKHRIKMAPSPVSPAPLLYLSPLMDVVCAATWAGNGLLSPWFSQESGDVSLRACKRRDASLSHRNQRSRRLHQSRRKNTQPAVLTDNMNIGSFNFLFYFIFAPFLHDILFNFLPLFSYPPDFLFTWEPIRHRFVAVVVVSFPVATLPVSCQPDHCEFALVSLLLRLMSSNTFWVF